MSDQPGKSPLPDRFSLDLLLTSSFTPSPPIPPRPSDPVVNEGAFGECKSAPVDTGDILTDRDQAPVDTTIADYASLSEVGTGATTARI